ncbi:ankyrin repeat and LEM domain-containing protein 1 isoform X2 [Hetaerina americana]|uniref:ankyrin repeat and LEM domain-containing protein 1 isoform X2 n=1 Tax=Hetaerina americana TaxID=62018 RepID=UPI003A7F47D0
MSSREVVLTWALRLYEAVENVDADAVKDLVNRKGANPDIILPNYGISVFHLAVGIEPISFSKEITATFLLSGGNPNVRSSEGLTPVHVAAIWGRAENLKLLLLAGGDPRTLDDEGCSPLHYAKEKDYLACIEVLQKFMRVEPLCSPVLGVFTIPDREIEPKKRENAIDLIMRKSFNRQNRLWGIPGCRPSMNACENEQRKYDEYCREQETKERVMQNIIIEDNNLISEDGRSEDSVQIIEEMVNSPLGGSGNKRSFGVNDETYSIHSSPEVRCSNSHYSLDDCMNQNFSRNDLSAAGKNGKTVKNTTRTILVHDSPNNYWSNSYLTNDASIEMGWSPVGDNNGYSCEPRTFTSNLSYAKFMLSADSSGSSTPLQKKISEVPRGHFGKICVMPRMVTCDTSSEGSSILSISCPELHQRCLEEENKNVTTRRRLPRVSHIASKVFTNSRSESEEYFTVPEEVYEITDEEEGFILEERRLETPILSGRVIFGRTDEELPREGQMCRASSAGSLTSGCTEDIRRELYKVVSCGCRCPMGPITSTTKRVYLKMIKKFKEANPHLMDPEPPLEPLCSETKFSRELEETLIKPSKLSHGKYFELEQKMMMQFDGSGKFNQWREGNQKSSFNYLLLDPRMTLNLPLRWANDGYSDKSFYSDGSSQYWREFLSSIFYVGKGKRSRPYSHLYEAVAFWRSNVSDVSKSLSYSVLRFNK